MSKDKQKDQNLLEGEFEDISSASVQSAESGALTKELLEEAFKKLEKNTATVHPQMYDPSILKWMEDMLEQEQREREKREKIEKSDLYKVLVGDKNEP